MLWDLASGGALRQFEQPRLDENSEILDGHWGPDGHAIALTDLGGRLSLYSLGLGAAAPPMHVGPEESFACGGATRLAAPREADAPPPPLQQYFASDHTPLVNGGLALQPGFALDAAQQVELVRVRVRVRG